MNHQCTFQVTLNLEVWKVPEFLAYSYNKTLKNEQHFLVLLVLSISNRVISLFVFVFCPGAWGKVLRMQYLYNTWVFGKTQTILGIIIIIILQAM